MEVSRCGNGKDTSCEGGMIARNPRDHADQWYISKEYVENNFEPED
jgi:hypothetical protein